jgi:hypothetical protein
MDISKCEYLIGMTSGEDAELANTPEAVAAFICDAGRHEDVVIVTPEYDRVLNTFGIYIDRCSDQAFLQRLLPVLIPLQHEAEHEAGLGCGCEESDESEDQGMSMT